MKRHFLRNILTAVVIVSSGAARADVLCPFNVTQLNITPEGSVGVTLNAGTVWRSWWLCSLSANSSVNDGYSAKTIVPESCRGILSEVLTAKASNRPLTLIFHGPVDCGEEALPANGGWPALSPTGFVYE